MADEDDAYVPDDASAASPTIGEKLDSIRKKKGRALDPNQDSDSDDEDDLYNKKMPAVKKMPARKLPKRNHGSPQASLNPRRSQRRSPNSGGSDPPAASPPKQRERLSNELYGGGATTPLTKRPLFASAARNRDHTSEEMTVETAAARDAVTTTVPQLLGNLKSPPPSAVRQPSPPADGTRGQVNKKLSPKADTTARQRKRRKKADTNAPKIGIGRRVKTTRGRLYHILLHDEQRKSLEGFPSTRNYYGKIISGNVQRGYIVRLDDLPAAVKDVKIYRKNLFTVNPDEEEIEYDKELDRPLTLEEVVAREEEAKVTDPAKMSTKEFLALSHQDKAIATTFNLAYGKDDEHVVQWKILADTEYVDDDDDPMKNYGEDVQLKKVFAFDNDIDDEDSNSTLAATFFKDFFPTVTGHAKRMDKFLSNPLAPMHDTVVNDKIVFHDEGDDDPDWIVKQCYLLMIAALTEADIGVENLWKRGKSGCRHEYANFGLYVPVNYFKSFQSAAAFMWCDEEHWFSPKRDRRWEIFMPALQDFNNKRRQIFHVVMLMMDESISGWKPKTSKTGGLPNISYEPRKPVDLGTMLRNAVECVTGCLVFQDVAQPPEMQERKEFFYDGDPSMEIPERSHLPKQDRISKHTAEVLRLVKGSEVVEGGWAGGDAWFGSVQACVELKIRMGVHSTFVVKKHTQYYPVEALQDILLARHGTRPAGHWVVMRTEIAGVKLTAIAYAWSHSSIAFFITTCGSTKPSPVKYQSKFENEWGEVDFKEIDRPIILHLIYEFLPLIDEHNKQRQSILQLEKLWPTRNGFYRLTTTLLGQSVVDFHRVYRYYQIRIDNVDQALIDKVRIIKFTDMMCAGLRLWPDKNRGRKRVPDNVMQCFERVRGVDGELNRKATANQLQEHNKRTGNAHTLNCFICRRYRDPKTDKPYINRTTAFWCNDCKMPLCRGDRTKTDPGRDITCLEEHLNAEDGVFACNELHPRDRKVPTNLVIDVAPASARVRSKRR